MAGRIFSVASDADPLPKRLAIGAIESCLGLKPIEDVYARWQEQADCPPGQIYGSLLESYGIDLNLKGRWPIEKLPDGPLLIVSNHPFGMVDGMVIGAIAEHFRRPFKALATERLMRVPAFRPYILPISFDETPQAMRTNLDSRNEAIRMLRDGSIVVIFPAGGVATAPRGFGPAEELPWKLFLPKLVQLGQASVLPIYMEGQNSLMFQIASRISLNARRLLLFREFRKQCGKPITVNIGDILPWSELSCISDRKARLEHVRQAVYAMQPEHARRVAPETVRQNHPLWREDASSMLGDLKLLRRNRSVAASASIEEGA